MDAPYPRLIHVHDGIFEIRTDSEAKLLEYDKIRVVERTQQIGWCDMSIDAERTAMYAAAKAVAQAPSSAPGCLNRAWVVFEQFQCRMPEARRKMPANLYCDHHLSTFR
jgi:hypothetical protein